MSDNTHVTDICGLVHKAPDLIYETETVLTLRVKTLLCARQY